MGGNIPSSCSRRQLPCGRGRRQWATQPRGPSARTKQRIISRHPHIIQIYPHIISTRHRGGEGGNLSVRKKVGEDTSTKTYLFGTTLNLFKTKSKRTSTAFIQHLRTNKLLIFNRWQIGAEGVARSRSAKSGAREVGQERRGENMIRIRNGVSVLVPRIVSVGRRF